MDAARSGQATEIPKFLPFADVARSLGKAPHRLAELCAQHGIPVFRFGRSHRSIAEAHVALLIERCAQPASNDQRAA